MRTLYLDCGMGAAGDMLAAALYELLPDRQAFVEEMNSLGIPGVVFQAEPSVKCGICGTHMRVTVNGEEEQSADVHAYGHAHEHTHEYCHTHGHEHVHEHFHAHEHEHGHCHDHNDAHPHDRTHDGEHACDHDHPHEHEHHEHDDAHGHCHEHEHGHEHDDAHHHEHSHVHRNMRDIEQIIAKLPISAKVKNDISAVYNLIAQAESHAHGKPVTDIHFHEVGTMDAIADITAVCLLIDKIAPQKIICSPIHVGAGHVHCAHGILPVPAPATAFILQGVPIYGGQIQGELCTPTGAALMKHFATSFGDMPIMETNAIGYGFGSKEFERINCLRAFLGETAETGSQVYELCTNLDDMTAEEISFAMDRLFEAGALEVFTTPACMKKSRPGTLLTILCREKDREAMVKACFKHTSTIGIRETVCRRYELERASQTLTTPLGEVKRKHSHGYGITRSKYEYDDIAKIAQEQGLSFQETIQQIDRSLE